ncbi:unnamed protein product [Bursaphelenchus okinawaensis]|uniref:Uncharacterized protein n=1 Tax=Bursaphelenchus okinawaensis TaxID=465554 RepID=A0A811L890_9BILA|nr:unnamed protein product [Bursaphelenchus okinawaensis]CAG9117635.1 unnamed protein product [Bursaphelenchus okinawaensis]
MFVHSPPPRRHRRHLIRRQTNPNAEPLSRRAEKSGGKNRNDRSRLRVQNQTPLSAKKGDGVPCSPSVPHRRPATPPKHTALRDSEAVCKIKVKKRRSGTEPETPPNNPPPSHYMFNARILMRKEGERRSPRDSVVCIFSSVRILACG